VRKKSAGWCLSQKLDLPQVDEDPLDHSQFLQSEIPNPDLSLLAVPQRSSSMEIPDDSFDLGDTPSNAFDELAEIKESSEISDSLKPENPVDSPKFSSDAPSVKSFKHQKEDSRNFLQ
jgi:hypothetical protein